MEKVNILIIGAGCVGLAIGRALAAELEDVVIVEKESSYGRHTSSRNSEVIHSGIYYPPGSKKARFCLEGRKLLYQYLNDRNIAYRQCGKLVIATSKEETESLIKLFENGKANAVNGLRLLSKEECEQIAPEVKAYMALLVPSTGIMDTHGFMRALKQDFEADDGFLLFDQEVTAIKKQADKYLVTFSNGEQFIAGNLINCAGLQSEEIAKMAGLNTESAGLKLHWCKAEYYKTSQRFKVDKLIYPLPDPKGIYLGIHLTLNLAGEVRFGPSAYYVTQLDYSMDEANKQDFVDSVEKYLRFDPAKLHPDDTGIRPKLQGKNEGFRDFYIQEEKDRGLPGFYNLTGIESPGLTSSLAIARHVNQLLKNKKA